MIHQDRLPMSPKTRSLEIRKKKTRNKFGEYCSEMYHLSPHKIVMLSFYTTSTVWFSEGHLPHNTITPNHDELLASPKMTTATSPYIPR
jgi:hypothetical protein